MVGSYMCETCGGRYFLDVPKLLPKITLGYNALGGAPHGPDRDCYGKTWVMIGDSDEDPEA